MKFRRRRVALHVALALGALVLGLGVWIAWPLPRGLTDRPPALSLALQDRHGLLLRTTRAADGSLAGWVPLGDMDPQLLQAFIALEDRRFYQHHGVDVRAVARALVADLRNGHVVSGGSTITMQLARMLRPAGRTWLGKLYQAAWALRLERHLGKQEILEQYLNRVPLGQGATGVSAAASLYFAASASHLSLGQAALVAGLASAPSADNPFVAPERARARRTRALARMGALGFVTREAIAQAEGEPLVVRRARAPFLAPHFTSRLLAWADDSGSVMAGTWRTSLDLPLQTELEAEVRHTVALLGDQGVRQGAAVVLDNRSGEILAWVGSPDFWADTAGQVDMVVSPRQPGSALKPFLYGLAFDRGITAASVLADVPRTYQTSLGPYQPRNYDRRFHGPVRAREALASSFNVPAVSLTDQLGVAVLLRTLHQAGFTTLDHSAEFYGLGLAPSPNGRVVSPGSAALVLDILSDPAARIPGFGVETPFDFPFTVAVKTGTSHHFTDNWAVGVTGGFTVAVWVGNFNGRPMNDVSGVTGAGPLLHRAVMDVARRYDPGTMLSPAAYGATRVAVCRLSGMLATSTCAGLLEWFLPGTVPIAVDDWQRGVGQVAWPAEYAAWAERQGKGEMAPLPRDSTGFRVVSPLDGDRYQVPPGMDPRYATIPLRAAGAASDQPVRWLVDGRQTPSTRWQLRPGVHAFRAVAASGREAEVRIEVR